MKLVMFLLLLRYLLRLAPASIFAGMLLMEDLEGRPHGKAEEKAEAPEKNPAFPAP